MEQLLIYLWSVSENISSCLYLIAIICVVLIGLIYIAIVLDDDTTLSDVKHTLHRLKIIIFISVLLGVLIPSKQDLALIFLYPAIQQEAINVVQSDTTKKILEVLNGYLDKQLKELKDVYY